VKFLPSFSQVKGAELNKFSGPASSQVAWGFKSITLIRFNKGDVMWTINPFAVIQIRQAIPEWRYTMLRKIIAITGSEVSTPQYYKTYTGASDKEIY
jgi:Na+-transporting NADH:ubiquinone oxidoreductase subunit A